MRIDEGHRTLLSREAIASFPAEPRIKSDDRPLTEFFDLESLSGRDLVTNLTKISEERSGVERVFTGIPDSAVLESFLGGHRLLVEGPGQPLSRNPRGMMEKLAEAAPYSLRVTIGGSRGGASEAIRIRVMRPTRALIPRLPQALLASLLLGLFSLPLLAQ